MIRPLSQEPDLADQVHAALLEAILGGELEPGSRYTQEGLAQRLGVSRQPIIQALRLLRMQGLIVETPNRRGVTVAPLDADFVGQLYELRAAIDAAAARAAARQPRPTLRAEGESILSEGMAAAFAGRIDALVQADLRFHLFVYEASGNPLLLEAARNHWHHTRRAMTAYVQRATEMKPVWSEHRAILEAIIEGDAERAAQLSHDHAANSVELLLGGPLRTVQSNRPGAQLPRAVHGEQADTVHGQRRDLDESPLIDTAPASPPGARQPGETLVG